MKGSHEQQPYGGRHWIFSPGLRRFLCFMTAPSLSLTTGGDCSLRLRVLSFLLIILLAAQLAPAATTFLWNAATPGAHDWNVNANWTPGPGNPGSADTAVF